MKTRRLSAVAIALATAATMQAPAPSPVAPQAQTVSQQDSV